MLRARLDRIKNQMLSALPVLALAACMTSSMAGPLPDPAVDIPLAKAKGVATAVFAGGCFWGIEAVFENVKGVTDSVSGYAGGTATTATYEKVSSGATGHAEAVIVTGGLRPGERILVDPDSAQPGEKVRAID